MKKIFISLFILLAAVNAFAQSDDDFFSDDDLFSDDSFFMDDSFDTFGSGDDAFFSSDDDMFFDNGIEEYHESANKSDLAKGIIFEDGSVKIGGNFSTSIGLSTVLYNENLDDFSENLKNTTLTPSASANISLDARPNQNLRFFTKAAMAYPFKSTLTATSATNISVSDFLQVKELFTDFSLADTAFFRFGLHTVTWGTGLFYSPVSDMINTSSIDPENTDAQVDGSLNLRTLISLPHSTNLWFYIIPDFDTKLAKDTAFAGKYEFLLGGWELGVGGYYKNDYAPKAMLTASGSIKKLGLFGEAVYQYGSDYEWFSDRESNVDPCDKSNIIKATAGFNYMWKDPSIILAAQYYYDGNDFDTGSLKKLLAYGNAPQLMLDYVTKGHNIAFTVAVSDLFDCDKLSLNLFGNLRIEKPDLFKLGALMDLQTKLAMNQLKQSVPIGLFTMGLNYAPTSEISIGVTPVLSFVEWKEKPTVSLKINFSLGGGNF